MQAAAPARKGEGGNMRIQGEVYTHQHLEEFKKIKIDRKALLLIYLSHVHVTKAIYHTTTSTPGIKARWLKFSKVDHIK